MGEDEFMDEEGELDQKDAHNSIPDKKIKVDKK